MTPRAGASEIRALVRQLASRSPSRIDTARARLSVLGGRAVDELLLALEDGDHRLRARVMPILALIREPRAANPLMAMLLDRSPSLRAAAARALSRFPSPECVLALERAIFKDRHEDVRIAAACSLSDLYGAGQDQALRPLLELLADSAQAVALRVAALAVVPFLPRAERTGALARLEGDVCEEVRCRAAELASVGDPSSRVGLDEITVFVTDLGSNDYARWHAGVIRLAVCGERAMRPLIAEMSARADDPEFGARAGLALRAMGPRRGRKLAELALETDSPEALLVLVETIGAYGEKSLIYRLHSLIERLAERRSRSETAFDEKLERVRARAHLELARVGSRVAIDDLRQALADSRGGVPTDIVAALECIGTRTEIPALLSCYLREDDFIRERVAAVVRVLMRRERIRRNDRVFQQLDRDRTRALASILPPPTTRSTRKPARAESSSA